MDINISGKVVVITGASKGIGSELARAFSKEGAIVVMNYCHSKEQAKKIYSEVIVNSLNSILIKADVRKADDVSLMVYEVVNKLGRVDVLINNAGICNDNLIQRMSLEQWQNVISVNLTGLFLCCKEFSKVMVGQNYGKIINIASLKGQEGSERQVNYSASKAGVIGFTKSLAKELSRYNILVNAVCPGFIVTDLNRDNREKIIKAQKESLLNIEFTQYDLTNFMLFIASDLFMGVSGRVFNLDSRL